MHVLAPRAFAHLLAELLEPVRPRRGPVWYVRAVSRRCVAILVAGALSGCWSADVPAPIAPTPVRRTRLAPPFVGARELNFYGGSGTVLVATIDAEAWTKIYFVGVCSTSIAYDDVYRLQMPIGDGEQVVLEAHGASLLSGGRPMTGCRLDPEEPCTSELLDADWWTPAFAAALRCD
jgi:hypothetical protein